MVPKKTAKAKKAGVNKTKKADKKPPKGFVFDKIPDGSVEIIDALHDLRDVVKDIDARDSSRMHTNPQLEDDIDYLEKELATKDKELIKVKAQLAKAEKATAANDKMSEKLKELAAKLKADAEKVKALIAQYGEVEKGLSNAVEQIFKDVAEAETLGEDDEEVNL